MKISFLAFLLLIASFSQQATGQSLIDFGYIVKPSGDSIQGQVKVLAWDRMHHEVLFKPKGTSGFQSYGIDQIEGYGFQDFVYVKREVSVPQKDLLLSNSETQTVFLLQTNVGELTVYQYLLGREEIFYLESDEVALTPLIYKLEKVKDVDINVNRAEAVFSSGKRMMLTPDKKNQKDDFGQKYIIDWEKKVLYTQKNEGTYFIRSLID
ncbi:MAG: hypothetical protein AAFQ83_18070 [Bacteroidota bacterium]